MQKAKSSCECIHAADSDGALSMFASTIGPVTTTYAKHKHQAALPTTKQLQSIS